IYFVFFFFFFQAEDGIRDGHVTGVQTCALPIFYVTSSTVPYPPDVPFEKRVQAWDISKPVVIPQAIVAAEQYDRIIRLVARGIRSEERRVGKECRSRWWP